MLAALAVILASAPSLGDLQRTFIEVGPRAAALADGQRLIAEPDGAVHLEGAWSVRFSLDGLSRGSSTCATTFSHRETNGPLLTQHRACGVTETWSTANQQLEHAFTLATRPPGRGDLRVQLSVEGPWHHADANGHLFAGPGGFAALRYGTAFIVRGSTRIALRTEHQGQSLVLVVPAAQLDAPSAFPMHIDPVLSTELDLATFAPSAPLTLPRPALEPALVSIGVDERDPTALAVWRDDRFHPDGDLFIAANVDGVFKTAQALTVRRGAQRHPALVYLAPRTFVVWEEPGANGTSQLFSCSFVLPANAFQQCLNPVALGAGSSPTFDAHGGPLAGWLAEDKAVLVDILDGGLRATVTALGARRLRFASRGGDIVLITQSDEVVPISTFTRLRPPTADVFLTMPLEQAELALLPDGGMFAAGLAAGQLMLINNDLAVTMSQTASAVTVLPTADQPDYAYLIAGGTAFVWRTTSSMGRALTAPVPLATLLGVHAGGGTLFVGTPISDAGVQLIAFDETATSQSATPAALRGAPSAPRGAMTQTDAFAAYHSGGTLAFQGFTVDDAGTLSAPLASRQGGFSALPARIDDFDVAFIGTRAVVAHFIDSSTLAFDSVAHDGTRNRTTLGVAVSDARVRLASSGDALSAMWRIGQGVQFITLSAADLEGSAPSHAALTQANEVSSFELDCLPNGPCVRVWSPTGGGVRIGPIDGTSSDFEVAPASAGARLLAVSHDLNGFWVALITPTNLEFHRRGPVGGPSGPVITYAQSAVIGTDQLSGLPGIPPLFIGQSPLSPTLYAIRPGLTTRPVPLFFELDAGFSALSSVMGPLRARAKVNGALLIERFIPATSQQQVLAIPLSEDEGDAGSDGGMDSDAGVIDGGVSDAGGPDADGGFVDVDAGLPETRPTHFESCGCSGGPGVLLMLMLLLPLARRRAANTSR